MKIGIISDIHEDILSLKESLTLLEKSGCTEIICLGDITGFDKVYNKQIRNPNASECITAIRSNCKYVVVGNHDLFSIKKLPERFPCFDFPDNWYNLDFGERKRLGEGKVWLYENEVPSTTLSRKDKDYLESLPEFIIAEYENNRILFTHSVYPDLTGSLVFRPHNPWNLKEHFSLSKKHNCKFSFSGHMHPAGFVQAEINHIKLLSFRNYKIKNCRTHYFCPCVAGGSGKNGLIIVDFGETLINAVRLNKKNKISKFYEWLQS